MISRIKEKTCELCERVFLCYEGGCWCDAIKLGGTALRTLESKYTNCLCKQCLAAIAAGQDPDRLFSDV